MPDNRLSPHIASMNPVRNIAVLFMVAAATGSVSSRVTAQDGGTGSVQRREAHPQALIPRGIGPHGVGGLRVEQLLQAFGWDTLRAACRERPADSRDPCSAESRRGQDSLLVYHNLVFPDRTLVGVTSWEGRVIRYRISRVDSKGTQLDAAYFDPAVWTEYARRELGPAEDGLHIAPEAYPATLVEAYYQMLGVEASREYGWICEYSTVGMAPPRREAVMRLVQDAASDLLRRLLRAPDVETRLYAADALLYLHEQEREVRKQLGDATEAERRESLEPYRLTADDLRRIGELRRSNEMVRTCGNQGSYKIYMRPAREVLDARAVRSIPARYAQLRSLGYGR